jgi:hypothetical protein
VDFEPFGWDGQVHGAHPTSDEDRKKRERLDERLETEANLSRVSHPYRKCSTAVVLVLKGRATTDG